MPKGPEERDLAKELLAEIIERPGQSSYQIAERVGEPHATACDALNDLRLRRLIVDDPRQILTGDNTVLEAQHLRATEEGREWFAQVSPPSRFKSIGVPAIAVAAVAAVAVAVGLGTDSIPTGVAAGGLALALLSFLRQR